jgi:hypothetical protein
MIVVNTAFALALAGQIQTVDTTYARLVREATTETRFLPPSIATLPNHPTIPSPLDHFGVISGAPDVAHNTTELYGYFHALAAASDRVMVDTIGRSENGRDIIVVAIANEETIANIERYKADLILLSDPRRTDRAAMERIVSRAKPVYNLQAGQHSAEMGPPEMVPELAYRLAVSDDPTIQLIRNSVITLLSPVTEPDGRDRQVQWYYRHTKGREWGDGFPRSVPYWGRYIYHDNNRDGIQITSEVTKASYNSYWEWRPTVMHDMHESVPFLYVSLGTGPYNRNIDPITKSEWQTMANWDVQHVTQQGMPGAWTWGFYDGWWRGYQTWIAANHNGIGRFFETFGNSSPETFMRDLSGSRFAGAPVTSEQWYRPDPPPSRVLWSLRNNTNYMQVGALSSLEYAARNASEMLRNFWQKGANGVARGVTEAPHAFVIPPPASQRDPKRAAYLVNQLLRHGIEVHRAPGPDANFVVLLNQPYRDFAVDLLTKQEYPQDAEFPAPDVAWTLGLIYGVEVEAINTPDVLEWNALQPVTDTVTFAGTTTGEGSAWLLEYNAQAELLPALAALSQRSRRTRVFSAKESFTSADREWAPGTLSFERLDPDDAAWLAQTFGMPLTAASLPDVVTRHPIAVPRIALYHTWVSTQDEGWVRYWFDQLGVPYTSIHKDDLRAGNLRERFDVIVVPPARGNATTWIHGVDRKLGPIPYTQTAEYPDHGTPSSTNDMTGGPGFTGLLELERFLDGGGTMITLGNAGNFVAGTGLVRLLSPHSTTGLVHPTSVVRATASRSDHPIMYGFPDATHLLRGNGPLWSVDARDQESVVLSYGGDSDGEYVLSGMVRNSDRIEGEGAIFDLPAGRANAGRVVVFTFNPMHRYLNHHDAPMLLNAIIYWNSR